MVGKLLGCLSLAAKYFIYICGFVCVVITAAQRVSGGLWAQVSQVTQRHSEKIYHALIGLLICEMQSLSPTVLIDKHVLSVPWCGAWWGYFTICGFLTFGQYY